MIAGTGGPPPFSKADRSRFLSALDEALAASDVTVSGQWQTARVTHAQLETHGSVGWLDDEGRLVIRASGTEPLIRVMVEGEDEQQVTALAHRIADAVKSAG